MKFRYNELLRTAGLALTLAVFAGSATWGRWMRPTEMPVSRLIKNVTAYIEAHPQDPHGYYTLGRINSAAFAESTENIAVYTRDTLPNVPTYTGRTPRPRDRTKPLTPRDLTYLSDAVANYKRAADLDPKDGTTWLGLGFQCEEALGFAGGVRQAWTALHRSGKPDAELLRQEALRLYRKAYRLTVNAENVQTIGLVNPISLEAAEGIVRLQANHRLSAADQTELTELQERIAAFRKRPRAISPILISFDRRAALTDLLAPEKPVRFDLAGDGLGRQWPWVKPTVGILVWDPKRTGRITSGLQLFGNVTWWLFWKDGYEPLAALDNDGNGRLEGAELRGIAVWFDRNGNGVSDPGEVVSLSSLGIKRIAARSTGLQGGVPANPQGVQLRDGSFLATVDWTPTSLSGVSPRGSTRH